MANEIRVLVIDEQSLARECLALALAAVPGLAVVGCCDSISEAVKLLSDQPADVMVLDYVFALEGTRLLRRAQEVGFSGSMVILMTGIDISMRVKLVREGVAAICPKNQSLEALVENIQLAGLGITSIEERYFRPLKAPILDSATLPPLEQLVIRHLMRGLSNKEIAARIGVSVTTVKVVLRRLYQFSGVHTRGKLLFLLRQRYDAGVGALVGA